MKKLDHRLIAPGICIVATSYGLARYAYGLFIPVFRDVFELSDSFLALTAACSYASYLLITIFGIFMSARIGPRTSILLGGLAASIGMVIVSMADAPWMLVLGVTIAGVSPGLAYTPFSEVIVTLVTAERQKNIYSIINSGTSLGVMLSGPVAILLQVSWRLAWGFFALFGLVATIWCVSILPRMQTRTVATVGKMNWVLLTTGARGRMFAIAFLNGMATSIYWAFSVDLVSGGNAEHPIIVAGYPLEPSVFGQIFWTIVGLAGFAGVYAGRIVAWLGVVRALGVFQFGIASATILIAITHAILPVIASGLIFGSFFVFMAATLGMWSLELFEEAPTFGFGTAFLLLSAGQFAGPVVVGALVGQVELASLFLIAGLFSVVIVLLLPRKGPVASKRNKVGMPS